MHDDHSASPDDFETQESRMSGPVLSLAQVAYVNRPLWSPSRDGCGDFASDRSSIRGGLGAFASSWSPSRDGFGGF